MNRKVLSTYFPEHETPSRISRAEAIAFPAASGGIGTAARNETTAQETPKKILVVEDESHIAKFIMYAFCDRYKITTVPCGAGAIREIRKGAADLVILDYRLPDISGLEVLKGIKQLRPRTPVIMTTAYGDEDIAIRSFRNGAVDYIKKPFGYRELSEKVDRILMEAAEEGHITDGRGHEEQFAEIPGLPPGRAAQNSYNIQKAVKYIESNYMYKISLRSAADAACLSKHHFSRLFKKITGLAYQDYVIKCRIEKAKQLLKNDSLTITEAALAVGCSDITHFERLFKRLTGNTPSQFKRTDSSEVKKATYAEL